MPAAREIPYTDQLENLTVRVEPADEKDIYYTDEAPEFELIVSNGLGRSVIPHEDTTIFWNLAVGEGKPDTIWQESLNLELDPGETARVPIDGEYLAFEGTGVIGIKFRVDVENESDGEPIILVPPRRTLEDIAGYTRSRYGINLITKPFTRDLGNFSVRLQI